MSGLAGAIRAWEAARVAVDGAKAIWEEMARVRAGEARDVPDTTLAARDMALRAFEAAEDREAAARHEVARLMPSWSTVGEVMPFDGAEGCVVDGRFYYQLDGEIHWMKVADPGSPPVAEDARPDCDREPCDMACPGCEQVGHVFYRIFHASDLAVGGWRRDFHYECRGCGHAWWVGGEAP